MTRNEIFACINQERERQDTKHPAKLSDFAMLSVLMEEVGEVAETLQSPFSEENLKEELIQVAAVSVRWLERFE